VGLGYQIMKAAAYDTMGRRHARLIIAWEITRRVAPWALAAVLLGGLGYAARWLWLHVSTATAQPDVAVVPGPSVAQALGAVPPWLWIAAAVLAAVLLWQFRPGRVTTPRERRLRAIPALGMVVVVAGMVGVALSAITGVG